MEYLRSLIFKGDLNLSCPRCGSSFFRLSLFKECLLCPSCHINSKLIDWVTFIRCVGDFNTSTSFSITREKSTSFFLSINTAKVREKSAVIHDSVFFSSLSDNSYSLAINESILKILFIFFNVNINDLTLKGFEYEIHSKDSVLIVYRKNEDSGVSLKVKSKKSQENQYSNVFFDDAHIFTPHISLLIRSMLVGTDAFS